MLWCKDANGALLRSSPVKGSLVHRFDRWKLLSETLNATRYQISEEPGVKRRAAFSDSLSGQKALWWFSAQKKKKSYDACIIGDVLFQHYFNISTVKETVILKLFQINVFLYISRCLRCGQFPVTWRLQRRWHLVGRTDSFGAQRSKDSFKDCFY